MFPWGIVSPHLLLNLVGVNTSATVSFVIVTRTEKCSFGASNAHVTLGNKKHICLKLYILPESVGMSGDLCFFGYAGKMLEI